MVRCYRYALQPSVTQVAAIWRVCKAARAYWNGLVGVKRWAEREIRSGRQASVIAEYTELLQAKALTGRAVSIARKRSDEQGISLEEAIAELRNERAHKLDAGVVGKDSKRIRFLSRRKLATEYAMESVEATRKNRAAGRRRVQLCCKSFRTLQRSTYAESASGRGLNRGWMG